VTNHFILTVSRKSAGYGVATISRLLKIIGLLFADYSLFYRALFQNETYNFKEPTNRSHPI